ncbi:MAG TPA: D-2-hydroxyacid dehydrogenase [Verrucomicrobiae bacterium]
MKIVVLDGFTLNPGDLSWDPVKQNGDVILHDRSSAKEVLDRLADADAALTNKVVIDRAAMERLPKLKYIGVTATGVNVVDVAAAKERGITVTNVPAYSTDSVAQATFALLLELTNRVGHHAQAVSEGRWASCPDFCFWDSPLVELAGLNLGIVGYGRIGQAVARIGRAFGMNVVATPSRSRDAEADVRVMPLESLLRESDVVTLHCPLTAETKGLMNSERLGLMKRSAYLLNTSRGPLVVENELAEALQTGRIAGAGLDVLPAEPPVQGSPLFNAPNCFITPHQAWGTRAARRRLMNVTAANLRAWMAGTPQNVVS